MKNISVEVLLGNVVKLDAHRLTNAQCDEIADFLQYNEWGLAYDVLAFAVINATYTPSEEAICLIKQAAKAMGVEYPNMCS